jgi:capsular polysaccharide biosynthesis protein
LLLVSRLPPWIGETGRELWLRLADTGLLGYRHRLRPLGFGPSPHASAEQTILDLDHLPLPAPGPVRLVSHLYRSSPLPSYPSIESWAVRAGASSGQAAAYRRIQFHTIRRRLRGPERELDGPYAVFPHLTSHFGHWVGDQLGAILWFAAEPRVTAGGRRLLVMAPSPAWAELLLQLCPAGSLELLRPEQWLEANLRLPDALLLPRLSSWQNLALARDRLGAALAAEPLAAAAAALQPEKLWLTSLRPERIANLEPVCALFRRHGYTVLDPTGVPIPELLLRLRRASALWCEHGSMLLNVLLCRTRPYRLLELDPGSASRYPPERAFLGGGLYNAFQRGLMQPFFCAPAQASARLDHRLHPYQRQLRVDLEALEAALSLERPAEG